MDSALKLGSQEMLTFLATIQVITLEIIIILKRFLQVATPTINNQDSTSKLLQKTQGLLSLIIRTISTLLKPAAAAIKERL